MNKPQHQTSPHKLSNQHEEMDEKSKYSLPPPPASQTISNYYGTEVSQYNLNLKLNYDISQHPVKNNNYNSIAGIISPTSIASQQDALSNQNRIPFQIQIGSQASSLLPQEPQQSSNSIINRDKKINNSIISGDFGMMQNDGEGQKQQNLANRSDISHNQSMLDSNKNIGMIPKVDRQIVQISAKMTQNLLNHAIFSPFSATTNQGFVTNRSNKSLISANNSDLLTTSNRAPPKSQVTQYTDIIQQNILQKAGEAFNNAEELQSAQENQQEDAKSHAIYSQIQIEQRQRDFAQNRLKIASDNSLVNMMHVSDSHPDLHEKKEAQTNRAGISNNNLCIQKRKNSSAELDSQLNLKKLGEIDELNEPFMYSNGNEDEPGLSCTFDIMSEVQPDMIPSIVQSPQLVNEQLTGVMSNKTRSSKVLFKEPSNKGVTISGQSEKIRDSLIESQPLSVKNRKVQLSQLQHTTSSELANNETNSEIIKSQKILFSSKTQQVLRKNTQERKLSANSKSSGNIRRSFKQRKSNASSHREKVIIVENQEKAQFFQRLSKSPQFRQMQNESQKALQDKFGSLVVDQEDNLSSQSKEKEIKEEIEFQQQSNTKQQSPQNQVSIPDQTEVITPAKKNSKLGNSPTNKIQNHRDSQATQLNAQGADGRGSEKTLPRNNHLEESPSQVRILSPEPTNKNHKRNESTQQLLLKHQQTKLLTINSRHQIIYKPPDLPQSNIASSKDQFQSNFMMQLQRELEKENTEKRNSVSRQRLQQPQNSDPQIQDMNRLVENLDKKKFEMLRNFIQTPDRHYLDTLGSNQKISQTKGEQQVQNSQSGSSINTLKNAPIKAGELLSRDQVSGLPMFDYVGNINQQSKPLQYMQYNTPNQQQKRYFTNSPFTQQKAAYLSQQTYPNSIQNNFGKGNSQIIKQYQMSDNLKRRQELLERMEHVFNDDKEQSPQSFRNNFSQRSKNNIPTQRQNFTGSNYSTAKKQFMESQPSRVSNNILASSVNSRKILNNRSINPKHDHRIHLATTAQNTTISTQNGGRVILPQTVSKKHQFSHVPMYRKTKKQIAASGAIRNQMYYPSALNDSKNDSFRAVNTSMQRGNMMVMSQSNSPNRSQGDGYKKYQQQLNHARRSSTQFAVNYMNSVKNIMNQRRQKISKMKMADYFRIQKKYYPHDQNGPQAYYPKKFSSRRISNQSPKRKENYVKNPMTTYYPGTNNSMGAPPLIDRERTFDQIYKSDKRFRDLIDQPEAPEFPQLGMPSRGLAKSHLKQPRSKTGNDHTSFSQGIPATAMSHSSASAMHGIERETMSSIDSKQQNQYFSQQALNWYREKYGFSPYTSNDPNWRKLITYMRQNPKMMMKMVPSGRAPQIPQAIPVRSYTGHT